MQQRYYVNLKSKQEAVRGYCLPGVNGWPLQIATDVSKYLRFVSPKVTWQLMMDTKLLKRYVDHLKESGIGVKGILTKLDRMVYGLRLRSAVPMIVALLTSVKQLRKGWHSGEQHLDLKRL
jgi:hypothetical protein